MFSGNNARQSIKIQHPLVRDAYLIKEASSKNKQEEVLVLEAFGNSEDMEFGNFDSYVYDLVTDLQALKEQAEKQSCFIDRVDICTH